jgi:hypothetical protein
LSPGGNSAKRRIVAAVPIVCVAIAMVGCGSGSDSTSGSTTGAGNPQTTTSGGSKPQPTAPAQAPPQGGKAEKQEPGPGTGEEFGKGDPYSAPKGSDNSVQVYGDEAGPAEKAEVTKAMFAYFRALATLNYAKACAELSEVTKKDIEQFMKAQHKSGGCTSLLKQLHSISPGGVAEAKKAAEGSVGHVRIGEGNAFVLFTPAGGRPSYFAMKEEGGEWKSVSASAGSPLVP